MFKQLLAPLFSNKLLILVVIYSLCSTTVWARQTHNEQVSGLDFVNQQLAEQMLNQTRALSNPQLVKAQADLYRAMYEALIKSGFSQEEALQIVVAMASRHDK